MKANPSSQTQKSSHKYYKLWWHTFLKKSHMHTGTISWNCSTSRGDRDLGKSSGLTLYPMWGYSSPCSRNYFPIITGEKEEDIEGKEGV